MRVLLLSFLLLGVWALPGYGQRSELGLLLGGFKPASRTLNVSTAAQADFSRGLSLYANYGIRIAGGEAAALFFEVPFIATPQHKIETAAGSATRDLATIYLTPGFRLKLAPNARVSPYVATGGGWALFEHSTTRQDGRENEAPRTLSRGAFNFGGGVDIHVWRFVSVRGEVRDFISGNPSFNVPVRGSIQHNVIFAGGLALKF